MSVHAVEPKTVLVGRRKPCGCIVFIAPVGHRPTRHHTIRLAHVPASEARVVTYCPHRNTTKEPQT